MAADWPLAFIGDEEGVARGAPCDAFEVVAGGEGGGGGLGGGGDAAVGWVEGDAEGDRAAFVDGVADGLIGIGGEP